MADPLILSPAERATLQHIVRHFPSLVEALREHVTALLDAVVPTVQGVVMTEAQIDDLLGTLVDRIVAGGLPEDREATRECVGRRDEHARRPTPARRGSGRRGEAVGRGEGELTQVAVDGAPMADARRMCEPPQAARLSQDRRDSLSGDGGDEPVRRQP